MGKQWEGLNRNIKNQETGVKLTKREKKQLRQKKKQESEIVVRVCNNIEKVNDKVEANAVDSDFQTDKLMINSESEVLDSDKARVQCLKKGCYIPLTVYVDTDTDLKSIATEVLSSLSDTGNTCTTCMHVCSPQKVNAVIDQNVQSKDVESTFEAKACNDKVTDRYGASSQKCPLGTVIKQCDNIKTTTNTLTSKCDMNIMLTGLHTCGDLASNMLKLFVFNSDVKCLCSVGCCYHLLTEQVAQEKHCPGIQLV